MHTCTVHACMLHVYAVNLDFHVLKPLDLLKASHTTLALIVHIHFHEINFHQLRKYFHKKILKWMKSSFLVWQAITKVHVCV